MRSSVNTVAWFRQLGLSAWLVALFVSAQLIGTAHAAAHGDQDHLHDGHPCIVVSIVKKTDDIDVVVAMPELDAPVFDLPVPAATCTIGDIPVAATGPIRAPPAA